MQEKLEKMFVFSIPFNIPLKKKLILNNFEILIQWLASQGGKRSSEVKESLDLNPRQNQRN